MPRETPPRGKPALNRPWPTCTGRTPDLRCPTGSVGLGVSSLPVLASPANNPVQELRAESPDRGSRAYADQDWRLCVSELVVSP